MKYALTGRAVFPDGLRNNWLIGVDNGIIAVSAPADSEKAAEFCKSLPSNMRFSAGKSLLAPAFVDIHCHAGDGVFANDDPIKVMDYHRSHGTGAMLLTLYRDIGSRGMLQGIEKIKKAMEEEKGILGVHLEGPYLNPKYGSKKVDMETPDKIVYEALAATGAIRMWTFAPEIENTDEFCRRISQAGIVPAIGHSEASYKEVRNAVENGAKVVTHIFNASGLSDETHAHSGTRDMNFDEACMLEDGLYYEVINDEKGVHVRPEMIRLLEKTVGKDRIVAITDCYGGKQDSGGDVNFQNGEIAGSRMTMHKAACNFLAMGYSPVDVFNFTSYNPSKAINMDHKVGSLSEGRQASILLTDELLNSVSFFCPAAPKP